MKKHSFLSTANQSSPATWILSGLVFLYVMTVLLLAPAKEIFTFQSHMLLLFSFLKKKLSARIYALVYVVVLLSSSFIMLLLFRGTMLQSLNTSAAGEALAFLFEQYLALKEIEEDL